MTAGGSMLWLALTMALCLTSLLILRRQAGSHRRHLARLEAIERAIDAMITEDGAACPRGARQRVVPRSQRAAIERLLRR